MHALGLKFTRTRAAAKRALLRAVLAPKTKGRKAEATTAPVGAWGKRGFTSEYAAPGRIIGWVDVYAENGRVSFRAAVNGSPCVNAVFVTEAEARAWVEWRAEVKR